MKTFLLVLSGVMAIAVTGFAQAPATVSPPPATENEKLQRALVDFKWKFNHPQVKNLDLQFFADGRCVSEQWTGTWTIIDARTVKLVKNKSDKTAQLLFTPDLRNFEGMHFDGKPVKGHQSSPVRR